MSKDLAPGRFDWATTALYFTVRLIAKFSGDCGYGL